jgi:hypothetical protein
MAAIIVYMEICGRVAVVAKEPVLPSFAGIYQPLVLA